MLITRGITRRIIPAAAVIVTLAVGGLLTGCTAEGSATATSSEEPITLEEVAGTEVNEITLTDRAAERLGIETADVREGLGGGVIVDYAALMYDASGQTWVYVSPEPLVYMREAVTVVRIDSDTVQLSEGPEAGAQVVVVGAAELFGAEFDTAH